nr:hypothetical protein [Rickettsia endosymbiont of Ceutorhynchus assimilis]
MDLVLLSRKDNENPLRIIENPLPIIVEFKANHEGANKAIEQINKNGYIYITYQILEQMLRKL